MKRKQLRLKGWDYANNGAYFITICTKDRKKILSHITVGDDDHIVPKVELSKFGDVVEKYVKGINGIDKYVIMPNHIHMIIINKGTMWSSSPTKKAIPQIIKTFKTLVSKEIGYTIFQRSYYDHIIRNQQDYEDAWNYIEGNPSKWKEDELY